MKQASDGTSIVGKCAHCRKEGHMTVIHRVGLAVAAECKRCLRRTLFSKLALDRYVVPRGEAVAVKVDDQVERFTQEGLFPSGG